MLCPKCKNETCVVDSRDIEDAVIRRRRECHECEHRFTTYERIEPVSVMVVKRDGSREAYQRDKLRRGIAIATQKRSGEEEIDEMVDRIEEKIAAVGDEVTSHKIGEWVIAQLKTADEVAYLRFASVYKGFTSAKSFAKELAKLK